MQDESLDCVFYDLGNFGNDIMVFYFGSQCLKD